jgi:hypothetical protein
MIYSPHCGLILLQDGIDILNSRGTKEFGKEQVGNLVSLFLREALYLLDAADIAE